MAKKNRTRQILGDPALRAVQSAREDEEVYRIITHAAVYMASAGFIDAANKLLTRLWSYRKPHSANVWVADRAITVMWHHSGSRPNSIPFVPQSIDAIEVAHRAYMSGNRWHAGFLENDHANSPEQLAIKKLAKAMIEICPTSEVGSMPSAEQELQGIADFEAFRRTGCCRGYDAFSTLTNLAELSAKHAQIDEAKRYIALWHDSFVQYFVNFIFECLPACRHASKLLLEGVLAKAYGLNQSSCKVYLEALVRALNSRMKQGETRVYGHKNWKLLLRQIGARAIKRGEMSYSENAKKKNWLGCQGASVQAIQEAEHRLGVQLPEDYKSFLQASNGFEPIDSTGVRLSPVGIVNWLANTYPDLLQAWNLPGLEKEHAALKQSLLIGDLDGEQQLLLVPLQNSKITSERDWQCWFFAHWVPGEIRYSGFRAYMEHVLEDLECN
jgi:hypothetical protein